MPNQKRRYLIRAILWILGGMVAAWGIVVFVDANVERVSEAVGWPFILGVGPLVGFFANRWLQRERKLAPPLERVSPAQPSREQVRPAEPSPEPTHPTEPASKKTIFVSYRRDDSADVTGRIYDRLSSRFGAEGVFKDVDSIPIGRDFREVIGEAVEKASVVVVVIGKHWLGSESGSQQARIHEQTDFVRTEVATSLQQGKPVIPVFVAGAKMPPESQLPDDIKEITFRNGVKVRPDPDFSHDVERLIRGIEQA
jgi:hypothetical protein